MTRTLLLLLVLVATIALLGKPQTDINDVDRPAKSEATHNDFLALGTLMSQLGMNVTPMSRLPAEQVPPEKGVLLLPVPGSMLSEKRVAALLAWVKNGGELVLATQTPEWWNKDPFLAEAGVDIYPVDDLDEAFGKDAPLGTHAISGLRYPLDDGNALDIRFDLHTTLDVEDDDSELLYCDPGGCHVARVPLGLGHLVVVSDAGPFMNSSLHELDHASVANDVFAPRPGRALWIVHDPEMPSLFDLLWRYAAAALMALLVLLLLWIWRHTQRFGPLLSGTRPARRRLGEHIAASGRWLADNGHDATLRDAVRSDFFRQLRRLYPQSATMNANERVALIVKATSLDEEAVRNALDDTKDVAQTIRRIEMLRNLLSANRIDTGRQP